MSLLLSTLALLLHLGLLLMTAPLAAGLLDLLVGAMTRGPHVPLLLAWRDLVRLWRKTPVTQENLSAVTSYAPLLELAATITALLLVPSFAVGMALSPLDDLLVVAALLIGGRTARVMAAFDAGAAASGLAAERAAALGVLSETTLLLFVVALGMMAGGLNVDQVVVQQRDGLLLPVIASTVALTALLGIVLTEAASHDGTIEALFNGPDLALLRLASWLRRLVWMNLIGALFLPIGMSAVDAGPSSWLIGLLAWLTKLFLFLFCLAAVQTLLGRIPRRSLADLIGMAALLSGLAVIIVLASSGAT